MSLSEKMRVLLKDLHTLAFWWAAWTLADQTLIRFHPWSELFVLAACACAAAAGPLRDRVRAWRTRFHKELASVTLTTDVV